MENNHETNLLMPLEASSAESHYNKPKLTPVIEMFESAVKSWRQYLRQILVIYWQGLKLALIPLGLAIVLSVLSPALGGFLENFSIVAKVVVPVLTVVASVIAAYFIVRAYMGIFLFIKNNFGGRPEKIFQETKKIFWPYIGLSLLTAVLVLLWTLLLIIPGIAFSVFYSCAVYTFFFEDKRAMAAIKRSYQLVKGYFWQVFGRILFFTLIAIIFSWIIALPASSLPKDSAGFAFWNAIVQVISFIVAPIAIFFSYHIYSDLVKIKK